MNPKSAIAKGKILEEHVASQIREKGIDPKAYRSHGSGSTNTEKGDIWTSMMIMGQNAGIECKNHRNLCIPEWWRQTRKLESLGREPVLVFKQLGEALGETKVIVYLDTLLDLIKASQEPKTAPQREETPQNDRELKWKVESVIRASKELLKSLE